MDRLERARAAERLQERDVAIASVSARAECFSDDPDMHDDHLRHMDLPARAERTAEPTERALTMAVYADGSTDRFENGA